MIIIYYITVVKSDLNDLRLYISNIEIIFENSEQFEIYWSVLDVYYRLAYISTRFRDLRTLNRL